MGKLYISDVKIENRKCFTTASLSCSPGINIIIGQNNSGKSTILKSICGVSVAIFAGPSGIRMGASESVIELQLSGGKELALEPFRRFLDDDGVVKPAYYRLLSRQPDYVASELFLNGQIAETTHNIGAGHNIVLPFLSHRRVRGLNHEVHVAATERHLEDFSNLVAIVDRLMSPYDDDAATFRKMCREVTGLDIVTYPSHNGKQLGARIGPNSYLPILELGDGVMQLVGLIAALCVHKGKIIVIEDVESDLHPEALKLVIDQIRVSSEYNQFFISTHSNVALAALAAAKDCAIFRVGRVDQEGLGRSDVASIGTDLASRVNLLLELGYSVEDMGAWSCWLICEESSFETLVNRLLIPRLVPDLQGRIRTLSSSGTGNVEKRVDSFVRLFLYLHLEPIFSGRAWVLVDGDQSGIAVIDRLRQKYTSWGEDHFIAMKKPRIEDYYPGKYANDVAAILAERDHMRVASLKSELVNRVCDEALFDQGLLDELAVSMGDVVATLSAISERMKR